MAQLLSLQPWLLCVRCAACIYLNGQLRVFVGSETAQALGSAPLVCSWEDKVEEEKDSPTLTLDLTSSKSKPVPLPIGPDAIRMCR